MNNSPFQRPFDGDDRGVSPVIGVVLMVGIFVIVAAVIGAFVLGFSPTQPAPETELAFIESGGSLSAGVTIVPDVGDDLDADNVVVQLEDGSTCEAWDGEDTISTGDTTHLTDCDGTDRLDSGDIIQIVWTDDTVSQSSIIATYEIRGTVRFADKDCGDIDEGDPVIIDDEVVNCDEIEAQEELIVENEGVLMGDGSSLNKYVELTGGTIDEDVESEKTVSLADESTVGGDVDAEEDVDLAQQSDVGGDLTTRKVAELTGSSRVDGDLTATKVAKVDGSYVGRDVESLDEEVKIDDGTVDGAVTAEDKVEIWSGSTVGGPVESRTGTVDVDGGSSVADDISADGTATVTDSTTDGDVDADGKAQIVDSTVDGSVVSETEVDLDGATIEEDVYVDESNFKCTDSTIDGQDCDSYSPKDPSEY